MPLEPPGHFKMLIKSSSNSASSPLTSAVKNVFCSGLLPSKTHIGLFSQSRISQRVPEAVCRLESRKHCTTTLHKNPTAYQSMTGFFAAEVTEDCTPMVIGIINLTETYRTSTDEKNPTIYFLPRRISQDLVENGFLRIRMAEGHGRLDHRSTIAAAIKVNTMKKVKSNDRSRKKRKQTDRTRICLLNQNTSLRRVALNMLKNRI